MRIVAPAKINLWFSVGPRRADGYHEIVSVMQAVSLFDELHIEPADASTFDVEPAGWAPEDETNLVVRALRQFSAATGARGELSLRLHKNIPAAHGLAGGSADAAATLVGLNEFHRTGISKKALEKMGAALGSDVPFCIRGGTAVARGRGDDLSPIASKELWWVLASSGESLSTASVYEEFDRGEPTSLEDPFDVADALARGDTDRIAMNLRNDLYPAAAALLPEVEETGRALREAGALGTVMSGSGPAWCGLARDEAHAVDVAGTVRSDAAWVEVACSVAQGARSEVA
ncbi:MAG: 4-(cytidine 5'-diphospho)-2-C-methyl-D-erythritol kinase [Actinomycetota bacterium]